MTLPDNVSRFYITAVTIAPLFVPAARVLLIADT